MNTRDKQHGGIVAFAIVGILLVSLLAGGLYIGRHQVRVAEESTPPAVAIDTEKEASEAGKNTPAATNNATKPQTQPQTPTTTTKPQASTPPASPKPASPQATVPVSGPSDPLPTTGPSDTLLGVSAISIISFAGLAFMKSNLHVRRSALNR